MKQGLHIISSIYNQINFYSDFFCESATPLAGNDTYVSVFILKRNYLSCFRLSLEFLW